MDMDATMRVMEHLMAQYDSFHAEREVLLRGLMLRELTPRSRQSAIFKHVV